MARAGRRGGGVTVAASLAAYACLGWSAPARAQEGMPGADGPISGSSEVLVGLGVGRGPAYLGSDERKTRALPIIAARWSNGWFAGLGGVGYRFNAGDPLSWGLRLTLDPGRDEDDADALRGMGDIEARPEFGVFASYRLLPGLMLGSSLRYGSGNGRDGLLADVSLRGSVPVSSRVRLTAGITATAANTRSMQSAFGVDAAQALNSGYGLYHPGSGWRDIGVQAGGMVLLQPNLMLFLGVNARTLVGDARDSPLTRERTGAGVLATLAYRL
jgi:MipA family protein